MGRFNESLADLNILLELNQMMELSWSNLLQDEKSLADLNKSLEIESNNAFALSYRGTYYEMNMMNIYEKSLADLNKSLEIEPNNAFTLKKIEEILIA